ncbi:hypothetical protein LCGC14_2972540, partial [marine sediment metagenome]
PPDPPKVGRGAKFKCLACGQVAQDQHIKDEGMAGRMGAQLMAIVAEGNRRRVYVAPTSEHAAIAKSAKPKWAPTEELAYAPRALWCTLYGLKTFGDLFTDRQLVALTTFSDLVQEARTQVERDALAAGLSTERATAYADAVATYLAFVVDRCADFNCSLARWVQSNEKIMNLFARQAIPMVWDFGEANILHDTVGGWSTCLDYLTRCLRVSIVHSTAIGTVLQADAAADHMTDGKMIVSTDPPYYDNIGYADLSDFFYVWLRRTLNVAYPDILSTLLVPKTAELVATPYRFNGDKSKAESFFETGLRATFARIHSMIPPDYPATIYYAFKQSELKNEGLVSTGWETIQDLTQRTAQEITGVVKREIDRALA